MSADQSNSSTDAPTSTATSIREEMVSASVKFLRDPKVTSAPLAKKIAFLESKGVTNAEIQVAISRVNNPDIAPPTPPPASYPVMVQPSPSIGPLGTPLGIAGLALGMSTLSVMAYHFSLKYFGHLLPDYLAPVQSVSVEEHRLIVKEELQLHEQALSKAIDDAFESVKLSLTDTLSTTHADNTATTVLDRDDVRECVEAVCESRLAEIQGDLKSLKALMLSRRAFPPVPQPTSSFASSILTPSQPQIDGKEDQTKGKTLVQDMLKQDQKLLNDQLAVSDEEPDELDTVGGGKELNSGKEAKAAALLPKWQLEETSPPPSLVHTTEE